jgi:hypothetical protein
MRLLARPVRGVTAQWCMGLALLAWLAFVPGARAQGVPGETGEVVGKGFAYPEGAPPAGTGTEPQAGQPGQPGKQKLPPGPGQAQQTQALPTPQPATPPGGPTGPGPAPAPPPGGPTGPVPQPQPLLVPPPGPVSAPQPQPQPQAEPAPQAQDQGWHAAEQPRKPEKDTVIEGELASVGAIGFAPWANRAGLSLGLERLGEVYYAAITPAVNWSSEVLERPFSMTYAIPFRIQILDTREDRRWASAGSLRSQDWNEVSDYARVIQAITWGGKEKHVYVDVNQFKASSIGHGTLMKRYNQNLNFNTRRVSAEVDAFSDYGGGEVYLNDITGPNLLGALAFVKPLSLVDRSNFMMRSFSLGVTVVADIDAPLRNKLDLHDVDDDGRRSTEILVDQSTFQPQYVPSTVLGYGLDAEVKLMDLRELDWKTYLDYSWLTGGLPTDDPAHPTWSKVPTRARTGSGFTWGHLVRMNLGDDPVQALRFRVEYRLYQRNYLPGYFDVLYEVQRVQYHTTAGTTSSNLANQTKLQQVLGREGGWVNGGYLEANWRISHYFVFSTGLELNDSTDDNNLFVHLEVPDLEGWQLMATYHRRTAPGFADLFNWFSGQNDLFMLKTSYRIGDFMHVVAEAFTPFGIGPDSFFRSAVQVNLGVEFGYTYGDAP